MAYNYSAPNCTIGHADPRYKKVIEQVRKNNSLVVNNISIAGEDVRGVYAGFCMLTFLRLHIENDTYHPHLFHYSVGVSVGSVIIHLILNIRFLYEVHSKELALRYLDAILNFLEFERVRSTMFDVGDGNTLGDFINPMLILKNLYEGGSACVRDSLVKLLEGNHEQLDFDNKPQYFTTEQFHVWLQTGNNLDNVFLICYSGKQTKMIAFTGNRNRLLDGINFIEYEFLRPSNLINAVLCSSAIPLVYPVESINGRDFAIDGAAAEVNQFVHAQILINCSRYMSANLIFTPELTFFGIEPKNNNNFLIMVNKINIQTKYESLIEFKESVNKLITSVSSLLSVPERVTYNAKTNVPLTALFLTQPYISKFSNNNMNHIVGAAYLHKQRILLSKLHILDDIKRRVPTKLVTETQFNCDQFGLNKYYKTYKEYKKDYVKYNPVVSTMIHSTYVSENKKPETVSLFDKTYKEQKDIDGNVIKITINICYFNVFLRTTYKPVDQFETYFELLLNEDTRSLYHLGRLGIVSGNLLYDTMCLQSVHAFASSKCTESITDVIELGYRQFLGPRQS